MLINDTSKKLFLPSKAESLAASLNESGDGWVYRAVHDSSGKGQSFIEVYDEEQFLVGWL